MDQHGAPKHMSPADSFFGFAPPSRALVATGHLCFEALGALALMSGASVAILGASMAVSWATSSLSTGLASVIGHLGF